MSLSQNLRRIRSLSIAMLVALLTPSAALAASQPTTGHTSTTPTFPVPASARVHPTTGGTAVAPTGTTVVPPTARTTVPQTYTKPSTTTPTTPAPTVTTVPVAPVGSGARQSTAAKPTAGSSGPSTPAIAVAVIAALLALGCAIWSVARLQAYEPRWTLSLRHTLAEAGFRASATWAEFTDWARLGR